MRLTRLSWFLLITGTGVVSAEGLSWSTPVILTNPLVWAVYGVHYLLIIDFLARRRALTLPAMAVGGLVLGLATESLMTKVIWNPPWEQDQEEEIFRFLGLGVYEVLWICGIWHVWMSTAIPLALTLHYFGQTDLVSERTARRILRALPLTTLFVASLYQASPGLAALGIVVNGAGIGLLAWFYEWRSRSHSLTNLALTRRERGVTWALMLLFYLFLFPERSEAWPALGPLLLGLALVVGSIVFLVAMGSHQAGQMPPPGPVRYRTRAFVRYVVYFLIASLILMTLASLAPAVAFAGSLVFLLISGLIGNAYLLRLARRAFRHSRIRKTAPQDAHHRR